MHVRLLFLLTSAHILATVLGCDGGPDQASRTSEEVSVPSETKVQAPGMTLWLTTVVEPSAESGAVELRLVGRASKNLAMVRARTQDADPHGSARLLSARRFEVVLGNLGEIDHVLSGRPLYLEVEASVGQARQYIARLELGLQLTEFAGDRQVWIGAGLAPTYVPVDKDTLRYRGWFALPRAADPGAVRVELAGHTMSELRALDERRWSFDLQTPTLAALLGTPSEPLRIRAALGGAPLEKSARAEVRVARLALTTASSPFPPEACDAAVADCLAASSGEPGGCGSYQQIRLCLPAAPAARCEPNLEWSLTDCVARVREDLAADPDRGWVSSLEALEYCTQEGDLGGPIFDELCGYAPDTSYCACLGQDDCFERFQYEHLNVCQAALRPRFDCALGSTTRELVRPGPRSVVLNRRVLTAADVAPGLLAAQVVVAVQQSAHDDVVEVDQAFARVDGGEVNWLDLWEGTSGRAVTVIEYGAGDNSYGAAFAYGTTTLLARIQDGDLYRATDTYELGCALPYGLGWNRCESNESCAEGFQCQGTVSSYHEDTGAWLGFVAPGKCAPASAAAHPRDGGPCSALDPCPLAAGLWCSTIASGGEGSCRATWMFGTFELPRQMDIPRSGTASFPFMVSGLATVPEEAVFEAAVNFGDLTKLKLALANPIYGTTSTFFDGPALGRSGVEALFGRASGEVQMRLPVWVPGDESVNGEWRLLIDTTARGSGLSSPYATNVIYGDPRVTVSSRWD